MLNTNAMPLLNGVVRFKKALAVAIQGSNEASRG